VAGIATLKFYSSFRGHGVSIGAFFARQRLAYWIGLIGLTLAAPIIYFFLDHSLGLVFAGMSLGAVSRDVGGAIRFKKFWPTLESVLNWPAVEQAIESDSRAG